MTTPKIEVLRGKHYELRFEESVYQSIAHLDADPTVKYMARRRPSLLARITHLHELERRVRSEDARDWPTVLRARYELFDRAAQAPPPVIDEIAGWTIPGAQPPLASDFETLALSFLHTNRQRSHLIRIIRPHMPIWLPDQVAVDVPTGDRL